MIVNVTRMDIWVSRLSLTVNGWFDRLTRRFGKVTDFEDRSLKCPVARAVARTTGWDYEVSPYEATSPAINMRFVLPDEAAEFIDAFDDGRSVQPFSFEIGELLPARGW